METTELTEYEQDRKPQEITMDTEMVISPRSLYREMVCPICLDILSHTRAAPDCLHRFCRKCLDKAVKKECPVCRKKLPSQAKSFREDPKFDQLIAKIHGGYRADQLEFNRDMAPPDCEIVLRHIVDESQTRYLKCPEKTTVEHLKRYLAIRPEGSKMPNLESDEKFGLCIMGDRSKGQYKVLSGKLRLDEIKSSYKLDPERPLEFYFYNPPGGGGGG